MSSTRIFKITKLFLSICHTCKCLLFLRSLYGYHNNIATIPVTDPRCIVHQMAAAFAPSLVLGEKHSKHFRTISQDFLFLLQESGYMHIQTTKPDTVGKTLKVKLVKPRDLRVTETATWMKTNDDVYVKWTQLQKFTIPWNRQGEILLFKNRTIPDIDFVTVVYYCQESDWMIHRLVWLDTFWKSSQRGRILDGENFPMVD